MTLPWQLDVQASQQLINDCHEGAEQSAHQEHIKEIPDDIDVALRSLVRLIASAHPHVAPFFSTTTGLLAARAPGRLDVMGGIADYSGATVLQLPLQESTVVICQAIAEPEFRVVSRQEESDDTMQVFCTPVANFFDADTGRALHDREVREYFSTQSTDDQWAAYVAGVYSVLLQQSAIRPEGGVALWVSSTVPVGKGVSSSAALEVATMRALCALLGLHLSAHQQAVLCQRVENHVVGAPCGLMDQMASSCGQQGSLLNMLCQPDVVSDPVVLPDGLSVWGIDSGIRHAVSGADYGSVRTATFMGYRYLLEAAGIAASHVPASDIQDTRWRGYLANVSVAELHQSFYASLPHVVSGQEFLTRFDGTTDTVTQISPERDYAVRACTAHPVQEHFRVRLFTELALSSALAPQRQSLAILMGECMYQSHAGYSSCGLNSEGTDDLVARLRTSGVAAGIYGARITGGGSGGVVAVLARQDADASIRSIAADYAAAAGLGGYVFSGSSPGASVYQLVPAYAG